MDDNGMAKIFSANIKKSRAKPKQSRRKNNSKAQVMKSKAQKQSRGVHYKHKSQPQKNAFKNNSGTVAEPKLTLSNLEKENHHLARSYQFSALHCTVIDYLDQYPLMPNLYPYFLRWLNLNVKNKVARKQLSKKNEVTAMVLSLRNRDISAGQRRPLRMPAFLLEMLQALTNVAKKSTKDEVTRFKFMSIDKLIKRVGVKPTFTKSSLVMLMLLGLFKPDKDLKQYLLRKVCKNDLVYQKLITSGYITLNTTHKFKYTTLSMPRNVLTLLNMAGLDMMKSAVANFNKSNQQDMDKKILKSCKQVSKFQGGTVEQIAKYIASPNNLISYKIQKLCL